MVLRSMWTAPFFMTPYSPSPIIMFFTSSGMGRQVNTRSQSAISLTSFTGTPVFPASMALSTEG